MIFLYTLVLAAVLTEKGEATCFVPAANSGLLQCSDTTCSGACDADNGCTCTIDPTINCVPTGSECLLSDNTCCPNGYYWSLSQNCCTGDVNCIPACQSNEFCQDVNGEATCTCNSTIYIGMSTSSLAPTVKCETNTMSISLNKCLLQSLGFDSTSLTLNNDSNACTNFYSEVVNGVTVVTMQAIPKTNYCGNQLTIDTSKVYYTNTLHIGIQNKTIITVNPMNISFTCSYNLTMQTSLATAFHPVMSTVNLTVNGEGSFVTNMAAYWDAAYGNPIAGDQDVPIGSNIYLGIFSDSGDGDYFVLRVENCFATPDGVETNVNKVQLVSGGCPATQDVYVQVQENGIALEARIQISSFAFQGQALVYITCDVRLCDKNTTCTGCNVGRSADNTGLGRLTIPMNLIGNYLYFDNNSASSAVSSWAVLAASLLTFLSTKLF
ncbi:pancreatic secretory granule membrane major glycoprotein GP2-like [Pelodytes ibericus]